ncbi:hypothetical protein BGZ54_003286 [Gamsiella multidivaricata]|nr:hypothetical protein BGZ54_003286 [Gamsiella multidivaricata]
MMKQSRSRAVKATAYPKAPALDMSSVSTTAPPENPRSDSSTRLFGLQDAPCYYPTADEFMEPLRFIESIRHEAERAGICKIIPPAGWKPPFALDTETFRFKTRIQKLNSMEGETRTNLNYLDQLYKFHRQQGHPVLKIPQLDKRPIDLFRLRKEVISRGGYQQVTKEKKWAEIGRGLDYTRKQCTSLSSALKSAYFRVILPYDIYLSKQGKTGPQNLELSSPSLSDSDGAPSEQGSIKGESNREGNSDVCEICRTESDLDKMLVCDGCELGYHTYCLTPPLQHIPKTDWYCAKCLVAGDDFGFEEGEEYSLSSFQQKCNTFKKSWFEKSGYIDGNVPEDVVEREFWRLVENAYETAEVEYGADLHSTQHGSGFPSLERHPNDKYSAHPANLNNIPVLPESLFCHIKTDISGMMVPWLYVGMCFSTFCWHNEDHYTYSVNYMHWGDTKSWYGVPASDALKFEDTMRKAVPELFEQQPDLLFQLVTMLSPERLVENGVKVVALDQRPGQFVVTFPQAYHAGFNHGFNFAEAVNFAPPDWCQLGLECVQRYKEHRKQPVFSHDELIMTTALSDTTIATAHWLQDEMRNLLDRELADRKDVLKQQPTIRIVMEEVDRPEEEVQCLHCNCYIYLSQVGCRCTTKVVCHDHIDEPSERFLRLRYSEEQLREIAQRVFDTAGIPGAWAEKYQKTMLENRVPSLKLLRSLLAEADRIPFPIKEAGRLRRFVAAANEWVEAATRSLVRKHHQGRRLTDRAQSANGKRLEDLQELLRQAERLRFDCPEIKQLEESVETMEDFRTDVRTALNKPEHDLAECRELYETGISMNIAMEELDKLEVIVTDLTWIERVSAKGMLQEDYLLICTLIEDAEKSGVSPSNPMLVDLIKKQEAGQRWEERAREVMEKNPVDLDELQAVIEAGRGFPVPRNVLTKADQLYNKAVEWQKTVEQLMKKSAEPKYENRPNISEFRRCLKVADTIPITFEHKEIFEEETRRFDEWFTACRQLLLPLEIKKYAGVELQEVLEDLKQNVETCTADEKLSLPTVSSNGVHHTDSDNSSRKDTDVAKEEKDSNKGDGVTMPHVAETEGTDNPRALNDESIKGNDATQLQTMDVQAGASTSEASIEKQEPVGLDASIDADREDQIYCLCRTAESGMMVECDECHEWYHGPCVRVTKREASAKSNYICPICNLSLVIKRDKARPTLEQLAKSCQDAQTIRIMTPELPLLSLIVSMTTEFQRKVAGFLQQVPITEEDISQVKGYLRKIEGLEIELPAEREALRTHVLRLCPSSMPVPGVMLSTYPTAPPLSTIASSCVCSQEHATEPELRKNIDDETMLQCGLCNEWLHISCAGLDLEQVQKFTKFICPICCIVRKKAYALGQAQYPVEVHARALDRIQANKDLADAKKKRQKSSKDSTDPATGIAMGTEEKKKRAYKRRGPSENGEKMKPKRRKSSGGQQAAVSAAATPTPPKKALSSTAALPCIASDPRAPLSFAATANVAVIASPTAAAVSVPSSTYKWSLSTLPALTSKRTPTAATDAAPLLRVSPRSSSSAVVIAFSSSFVPPPELTSAPAFPFSWTSTSAREP